MRSRLTALALLVLVSCEDRSYREIGGAIDVLAKRSDALVAPAEERLVGFGRRALPQIEIALHTARPAGKVNLVRALERIGEPEALAVFRHFAVYDPHADVRQACEDALRRWAATGDGRAQPARAALARVAEKRAQGEGPVSLDGPR